MTYSANSYESPFYGIGCATATDLMGTWTKYEENPCCRNPENWLEWGTVPPSQTRQASFVSFSMPIRTRVVSTRAMYISDVSFEKVDGVDRMRISKDYMTPKIVK